MKNLLLLFCLISCGITKAQYNINWTEAPLNEIPIKYKREHFNLKGPVKQYQLVGNHFFDKQGFLIYGNLGTQFEFTYDSNYVPLTHSSWISDGFRPVGQLILDSKGRIIENKKSQGSRYTYDTQGNWTGTIENNSETRKTNTYIYTYDSKNRMIKAEYYSYTKKIAWEDSFTYTKDGDFVAVTTSRKNTDDPSKNFTKTTYYKNGVFYGSTKNDNVKYDRYGNVTMSVLGDGRSQGYSSYKYIYYGDAGESDDLNYTAGIKVKAVNADPNCIEGNCTDGFGVYKYNNGRYVGFFVNGKKNSYGDYKWTNGDAYRGMWVNNEMDGYALLTFKAGGSQNGVFKNGKLHGLGVTIFANKTGEYGEYTDGKLTTKYNYYNNNTEKGCTAGDCYKGYGKFVYDNGTSFIGFYKNGFMHQGYWYGPNGIAYSGQFGESNKFSGHGLYTYTNGDNFAGQYVNGKKEGKGWYMYIKEKKYTTGEWVNDIQTKVYLKN